MNGPGLFGYRGPKYLPLALAASGVLCLVLVFVLAVSFRGGSDRPAATNVAPDEFASEGGAAREGGSAYDDVARDNPIWVVYVTGAVMKPGVYEIPAGSRVNDAVKMAGGFLRTADEEAVNLAEEAEDGLHVSVPEKSAAPQGEAVTGTTRDAQSRGAGAKAAAPARGKSAREPGTSEKVNINEATAEDLRRLPGIGPVISSAIVAYREANGPFTETLELTRVKGIGRKRFDAIRDFVTVSR
ncbi:MAG: helix-hairpin-helix domain-containing protein [Synergistaceae bacterium]|jgi:competence protein ComEA|nr:helix-hairpin-helix domain-containing protein [Synergistaceae bacterium]